MTAPTTITDADETLKGKTMFASLHTSTLTVRHVQSRGKTSGLLATLRLALHAHAQRRHLAALDDHALSDIGLSRSQALAEANRPLWDVPTNWRV